MHASDDCVMIGTLLFKLCWEERQTTNRLRVARDSGVVTLCWRALDVLISVSLPLFIWLK